MDKQVYHLLIVCSVFIFIFWIQHLDDTNNKRKRINYFDTFKFPLLVSSICGIILIIYAYPNKNISNINPFINSNNFGNNKCELSWFDNQQLYTDMPGF